MGDRSPLFFRENLQKTLIPTATLFDEGKFVLGGFFKGSDAGVIDKFNFETSSLEAETKIGVFSKTRFVPPIYGVQNRLFDKDGVASNKPGVEAG